MIKTTEQLINEIRHTESMESFLRENEGNFQSTSLAGFLQQMLKQYGLEKSKVLARAEMKDNNYGYELFRDDTKKPSRDKLIQLCMGFPLELEDVQKALISAKLSPLYPRDKRDAIIMIGIQKKYTVNQLNTILDENEFALLF